MQTCLDKGHAELAPELTEQEEAWYLPLFGVYHPRKEKLRVVFDSSVQCQGLSLNNVLLTGPDLTNSLLGILMKFRREKVAIVADIEQMFYSFYVPESDRNYLRFFWHEDNDMDKDITEYRMCVHVFGNSPSPAIATYGLRKCVQPEKYSDNVKSYVENNFYVDDGLASYSTASQAVSVLKEAQLALWTEGRMRLHKIASNDPAVMAAFPADDLAKDLKHLDLSRDELPLQHSLGLGWDLNQDAFVFHMSSVNKPHTRRGVLSVVNGLFDPLGFLSPITLQGKLLMRDLVAETKDWDEPLSEAFCQAWKCWRDSLASLEGFTVPRCYSPHGLTGCPTVELHVFSDASEKAISTVAYLRTVSDTGKVELGFVSGKSKVAPKHGHTIPRLELCAAQLAVEMAEVIVEHLKQVLWRQIDWELKGFSDFPGGKHWFLLCRCCSTSHLLSRRKLRSSVVAGTHVSSTRPPNHLQVRNDSSSESPRMSPSKRKCQG